MSELSFDEFWDILVKQLRTEPMDWPEAREWIFADIRERARVVFEQRADPTAVVCTAVSELMKYSAEVYGERFGLPKVTLSSTKAQPAWLQFVIENAKEGE